MATSSSKLDDDSAVLSEDLFNLASNVNVSDFVSVKLSGPRNYVIWMGEMVYFLQSQELLHIISNGSTFPVDKGIHKITQYDKLVKGWILSSISKELFKNCVEIDSAYLLWKELHDAFNEPVKYIGDSVGFTFGKDLLTGTTDIENTSNNTREELYEAAVEGCWWKAKSLMTTHKIAATEPISKNGNTILHISVEMGRNYFVEKLLEVLKDGKDIETKNSKGQTALHIAAVVSNEYAFHLLIQKRIELLVIEDDDHYSPLVIAFRKRKFNISYLLNSLPSSNLLDGELWKAVYTAIEIKQYDFVLTSLKRYVDVRYDDGTMLFVMTLTFPTDLGIIESFIYPSFHNVRHKAVKRCSLLFDSDYLDKYVHDILRAGKIYNNTSYKWLGKFSIILLVPIATLHPIYHLICLLLVGLRLTLSMFYFLLWKVLALAGGPIKNIEKKKKDYKTAKELLSLICNRIGSRHDIYYTSIHEAVRVDVYEVLDEILFTSPVVMNTINEEGLNIIQLAIINRSEKVYNLIHHIIIRTESYRIMKDSDRNNLAHLVGRLAPSFALGRTTGAALQLQRELLWYKEVEKLLTPIELKELNLDNETPAMVFTREHQDLMKEGENWMKTTAESCSITAALIVTIVFAAAITVPGGSNQESGVPLFKKEIAFTIFALSNAFSLFASATSLLLFLSILTTRFSEKDFLVTLPRRLIFGLSTLFLSTTAMIVAFGAILFLVFCDQRPWMLAPIVIFSCLPISVIVTIKLPLLIDLIQSTYFPIFGKQSYLESCRINEKNTVFK